MPDSRVTGVAAQYVADDPQEMAYRTEALITNLDDATDRVIDLLRRRIHAVVAAHPGRPALMLSGGIDSILVAAVCADLGLAPYALTVVTESDTKLEDLRGRDVARLLAFPHEVVDLDADRLVDAAIDCIRRLGTWELWEITSAIPVQAAFGRFAQLDAGPVFTGAGSDALFMGGGALRADPDSTAGLAEFRSTVTAKVSANFTRHRLVPDYYERLLGDRSGLFIQIFQTATFWRYAMSLSPGLLWRHGPDGRVYDKFVLRNAAARLGVPPGYVWTDKAPLQVSSGVIGALMRTARADIAAQPGQQTYDDPRHEPLEHTIVRQYLRHLDGTNR
ncbi:asparagine synthase C-terminal domain-containing protein [Gordonia sp. PP30]|uniref:asparagine synthase C-terminal domain-containing protein n=1 Tax=Gordonia sp. PP30 TaxID=2935861 RepID=UPI001FFF9A8C|nr:asparagine synthase C-terminal domain-containing protein [Gordonia sp. PP30]UQE73267.1 asparagine synthase C-terminal domain-containing protein [Gordonia sp. PP30]